MKNVYSKILVASSYTVSIKTVYITRNEKSCPHRQSEEEINDTNKTEIVEYEDSETNDDENTSEENVQFISSTPKNRMFPCEECMNQSQ